MTTKGSKINGVNKRREVVSHEKYSLPDLINGGIFPCAYKFYIPTIGWDTPIYIIYGGKLRQAFIKRIAFNLIERSSDYTLEIAGVGMVLCYCSTWYNRSFSMFSSIADFSNNIEYSNECDYVVAIEDAFTEVSMCGKRFSIIGANGTDGLHDFTAFRLVQYVWDEHTLDAVCLTAKIPPTIIYDNKRGFYFDNYVMNNGVYSTAEECIRDNTIHVVLFKPNELKDEEPLFKVGTKFKIDTTPFVIGCISDDNLSAVVLGTDFGFCEIKRLDYLTNLFEKGVLTFI